MDAQSWIQGLLAAVIGGSATAGGSWLAINAAGAAGAAVPTLNWKALGIILLVGAATNMFAFLQKSPIPTIVTRTSTSTTATSREVVDTVD